MFRPSPPGTPADKSCTKCKTVPGQKTLLMPKNAIFTNGNYGESMVSHAGIDTTLGSSLHTLAQLCVRI